MKLRMGVSKGVIRRFCPAGSLFFQSIPRKDVIGCPLEKEASHGTKASLHLFAFKMRKGDPLFHSHKVGVLNNAINLYGRPLSLVTCIQKFLKL